MKKILFITTALFLGAKGIAQTADFENSLTQTDTSWFGQDQIIDGDTTFTSGGFMFANNYNSAWGSFQGWAYSNTTDVTTAGYGNQFSNITGSGQSSDQFGICYTNGNPRIFGTTNSEITAFHPYGAYFTNTTYAYLSMLDGDSFAKQFGSNLDASGSDDGTNGEDWFLLTIYGINADSSYTGDSVNFYLADYRFADNNDDYLVNEWEWVDLSSLGLVHGLDFKLTSSDNGMFGMNTPAYFAMDNLSASFSSIQPVSGETISSYPNPTNGFFTVDAPVGSQLTLYNISGQFIMNKPVLNNGSQWDICHLENGLYIMSVEYNGHLKTIKIIKE